MKLAMPLLLGLYHQQPELPIYDPILVPGEISQHMYVTFFAKFLKDSLSLST